MCALNVVFELKAILNEKTEIQVSTFRIVTHAGLKKDYLNDVVTALVVVNTKKAT